MGVRGARRVLYVTDESLNSSPETTLRCVNKITLTSQIRIIRIICTQGTYSKSWIYSPVSLENPH